MLARNCEALVCHFRVPRFTPRWRVAFIRAVVYVFISMLGWSQQPPVSYHQLQQFGATQDFGIDSVDLTSLTVKFGPTLLHKAGRGLPLNLQLTYAASSTRPVFMGWLTPLQNLVGQATYSTIGCSNQGCGYNVQYVDPYGTSHGWQVSDGSGGWSCTAPCVTQDGTGLVLTPGIPYSIVTGPDGASLEVPSSTGSGFAPGGYKQDSNGNLISETSSTITDTLRGTIQVANFSPLMQVNPVNGPPAETYTYLDSSGASRTIAINYGFYSVDWTLPSSPCAPTYQPVSSNGLAYSQMNLPMSIGLPNDTSYTFSYETSP
jgi:hypothetical protein